MKTRKPQTYLGVVTDDNRFIKLIDDKGVSALVILRRKVGQEILFSRLAYALYRHCPNYVKKDEYMKKHWSLKKDRSLNKENENE